MKCSMCERKAIYFNGKAYLCKEHFIEYFESKVLDTIKKYELIKEGDRIGVGVSGGKDSTSLLYFLNKYKDYLGIEVIGIHIDEGIEGYRNILTEFLLDLAKKFDWKIKIYRFKDYFDYNLDDYVKRIKKLKPCTICGVFRRWLMWKASMDLELNKFATAHNLNDEVQTILMNMIENNRKDFAKEGPKVGIIEEGFITRIKPFYFIKEKETLIYSIINGINPPWAECKYIFGEIRDDLRRWLYKIESEYPGFHENFIKESLDIVFKAKKDFPKVKINKCKLCGYPTSREICRACEIKNYLN
ncbi:MAG: TIGR00269 family protein [Candidatus Nanoclepta minutus]|uniref:TIGR00269 family protein n=1 Tax=Candidatus Nanoclepta minutus TaxID=1940235 RepID=A0A397WN37_9ARCH|nr:MAG: TIGR00269 family protein [Candidatus Nanoclepta minutus]